MNIIIITIYRLNQKFNGGQSELNIKNFINIKGNGYVEFLDINIK